MHRRLAVLLLAVAPLAHAQGDVALVEFVAGEASYASASSAPAQVIPFMKVRESDRFTLARGAQVRLLYFQSAKQEYFVGPASFTTGREASKVQSGAKPQVSSVPAAVPRRIARIPELVENAKLGGVQLRSKPRPEDAELREARALYRKMRKEMAADSVAPELYLYATLSEYGRTDEMQPLVREMLRRQPGNEEVKALALPVK